MNIDYTRNGELKRYARSRRVALWEIAECLGMSEVTFSRRMRHELPAAETEKYKAAVDEISARKAVTV